MYAVTAGPGGLVLLEDGVEAGRVGVRVEETCPAELLGELPPYETNLVDLTLPWGSPEAAAVLLDAARTAGPAPVQARLNAARPEHLDERRAAYEAAGWVLFQEKQGYCWTGGPVEVPDRLTFRTLRETGREAYRDVLAACGEGTLDRNDAWYRRLAGAANWGSVFLTFADDPDLWLLASLPSGEPVGVVAMAAFGEPGVATVVFIGVVPGQRGRGHVDDLLRAGTAAARDAGHTSVLSDADVENVPMRQAFLRAGHRDDVRPWHVWHYRSGIVTPRLVLEPLRAGHAEEMAPVLADPALYAVIGGGPVPVEELRARYARQIAGPAGGAETWHNWVVRASGAAVGHLQATVTGDVAELAWVIGTAYQGRGYAKEAALGAAEHLRGTGVRTLTAHIAPGHAPSESVARALGLTPTGILEDAEVLWRSPPA